MPRNKDVSGSTNKVGRELPVPDALPVEQKRENGAGLENCRKTTMMIAPVRTERSRTVVNLTRVETLILGS